MFERIKKLSEERGENLKKAATNLDFGENYFYSLKKKSPTSENLKKIADYFDVSTDYLLGRTEIKKVVVADKDSSDDTSNHIGTTLAAHARDRNHEITPEETDRIIAYLDGIIDADQNKK